MAKRFKEPVTEQDKVKVTKDGLLKALRVFSFISPYKWKFIAGLVFLSFSSLTALVFPFVTGKLVDAATGKIEGYDRNTIAMMLMGVLCFQALFSFTRVWLFTQVSENAMRDIRLKFYSKIITLPIPFFEERRVGELTSRLTADVSQLQDALSFTLAEFFRQVITLLVGISVILYTSTKLTAVMLASFPLLVIGAMVFGRFIRKLSKTAQDELANANIVAEETLTAIYSVKAFTNEGYEINRYHTALNKVLGNALKAAQFRGMFISFVIFAIFGGIVLVLWYGLGLVAEGSLTIGSLVSFIIYTTFIGGAVGGLGDLYGQLQKTIGASGRVLEILEAASEIEPDAKADVKRISGDIVFDKVSFAYPSRPEVDVLKQISFIIPEGSKVALVGMSGAGKSTISQLLMRYYEVEYGSLIYAGKPLKDYGLSELRANIGIVPQDVVLFGGTIGENIAYGKPGATEVEIRSVAERANAWEFISRFPEGLNTLVGERGVKLSGGQRQRLAIARAILKNPALLILDEATSSLDAESEKLVQDALNELMKDRTTLIIAHRLATIRQADNILVLDGGKIVEQGTHKELEQSEGAYNRLLQLQLAVE